MNRTQLKSVIKKLVLKEITINTNNVGTTDNLPDEEAVKTLEKSVKDANVEKRAGSSKITASSPKHQIALSKQGDNYDVVSITNGSDRRIAKNLKLDEVGEFIKKHAEDTKVSYVDKARDKALDSYGKKKAPEQEKDEVGVKIDDSDEMKDTKETTQEKVADKDDKKADEKFNKEVAPISDDTAPQLGGKLVDKIEAIIDKALKGNNRNTVIPKDKVNPKKPFLKTDPDKESPDKLAVKLKETPNLKLGKDKETPKSKSIEKKKK